MVFLKINDLIRHNLGKRDKVILISFWIALAINIFLWLALLLQFGRADDFIILRYNIYFGISSLGQWYKILFIPLTGLIVLAVNYVAALVLYLNYKLLSYIAIFSALAINVIILTVGALLIYSNL